MKPQEILAKLENKYANCTTYRDSGYMHSWQESCDKTNKPQIVFTTHYEQPTKIRFEWLNSHSQNLLWCDGIETYSCRDSYNSGPKKERCESPEMAIAGHTGISRGTAFTVPSLLLKDMLVGSQWCLVRSDIKLVGMQTIGEYECYCIQGTNFSPNDTTIWISKSDFSLRRQKRYVDKSAIPPGPKIRFTAEDLGEF